MAEVIRINVNNPDSELLERVADAQSEGKLVIYPTETVYGLGTIATDDDAVERLYEVKERSRDKPISIAVDGLSMAYYAGKITGDVERLIGEFMPGPLTIIVEKRPSISDILSAGTGKIGIRIPDHSITREIIGMVRRPITTTSANISGSPSPVTVDEALEQIGGEVDMALDAGPCELEESSTVIDVTGDRLEIVREGPISMSEIRAIL